MSTNISPARFESDKKPIFDVLIKIPLKWSTIQSVSNPNKFLFEVPSVLAIIQGVKKVKDLKNRNVCLHVDFTGIQYRQLKVVSSRLSDAPCVILIYKLIQES